MRHRWPRRRRAGQSDGVRRGTHRDLPRRTHPGDHQSAAAAGKAERRPRCGADILRAGAVSAVVRGRIQPDRCRIGRNRLEPGRRLDRDAGAGDNGRSDRRSRRGDRDAYVGDDRCPETHPFDPRTTGGLPRVGVAAQRPFRSQDQTPVVGHRGPGDITHRAHRRAVVVVAVAGCVASDRDARPLHRAGMARRGEAVSAGGGRTAPGGNAVGARLRHPARRSGEHPRYQCRHQPRRSRIGRRVLPAVRNPDPGRLRRDGVLRRGGRVDGQGLPRAMGRQARAASDALFPGCGCGSSTTTALRSAQG